MISIHSVRNLLEKAAASPYLQCKLDEKEKATRGF